MVFTLDKTFSPLTTCAGVFWSIIMSLWQCMWKTSSQICFPPPKPLFVYLRDSGLNNSQRQSSLFCFLVQVSNYFFNISKNLFPYNFHLPKSWKGRLILRYIVFQGQNIHSSAYSTILYMISDLFTHLIPTQWRNPNLSMTLLKEVANPPAVVWPTWNRGRLFLF